MGVVYGQGLVRARWVLGHEHRLQRKPVSRCPAPKGVSDFEEAYGIAEAIPGYETSA